MNSLEQMCIQQISDSKIPNLKHKINQSKKNITKEDIYRLYPNIDLLLQNDIDLFDSIKSGI